MSALDTLVVTFQAQVLDVMETVVKTAMYKVTQLVEDCFLDEMKRRNQELETLRIKLEYAEMKLNDHGVKKDERIIDISISDDDDGSAPEERLGELHDVLMSCGGGKEVDSGWTGSQNREIESEADGPPANFTPEEDTHKVEHADMMPAVNVKEEVNEEGSAGAYAGDCQESSTGDVFFKNKTEKDVQISNVYNFLEGLESSDMTTELFEERHTGWTGLARHHNKVGADGECDPAKSNCSLQQAKNELLDSVVEDDRSRVNTSRDQLSTSELSSMQNPDSPSIPIKQELLAATDGDVDIQYVSKKALTKSGIASFSCVVTQNPNCHESVIMEGRNSKDAACDRLQALAKHVRRPLKKPPPIPSNSTAALSQNHTQISHLNPVNKIPSTSKATPPTVQRDHLANKLTAALWVNNKTQPPPANSHHGYLLSHPDSHHVFKHSLRCSQCGKCFPHPSNLKAHLQTHTGERPFCCPLCGRSFTKLSNLKAHRRVHTGERPYCCLACGKRFTQKCNLKRHQRIHVDG
ncbi:uncharacterized protein LOC144021168 isoform X2 [Festucalex cinctus]